MKFEDINVRSEVIKALKEIGIVEPTDIQAEAIPLAHEGKDIIGVSKTGSGKTAAFGIPLIEKMIPGNGVQALVLAPTRELAIQISDEIKKFSKYLKVSVATVYGGVSINPQIKQIERSEIVVGTPGRVLDHIDRRTLDITKLTVFVLDEADKMVDMGFIEDIYDILDYTPESQQMFLFGATISTEVRTMEEHYMRDPATVKTESQVQTELLKQVYYSIDQNEKFSLLVHLLKEQHADIEGAIIFCSTRDTVELLRHNLKKEGFKVASLHGKMTQNKRISILDRFNEKKGILVASSVAARGLHIEDVTHVFNYDLSQDPEEYIHRIGRTARAGESGIAITLLSHRDHETFSKVLQRYDVKPKERQPGQFKRLRFDTRRNDRGRDRRNSGYRGGNRRNGPKRDSGLSFRKNRRRQTIKH
jgi:ATP-dependent RNA helicase DeaD